MAVHCATKGRDVICSEPQKAEAGGGGAKANCVVVDKRKTIESSTYL